MYKVPRNRDSRIEEMNDIYDGPSKSQKKRDADALQVLGKKLIGLDESVLNTLPLTEVLHQALRDAKRIKAHGALRRQTQLIGKLMRAADHEAIATAFAALQAKDAMQTEHFHVTEAWRDKLIEGGKLALSEFVDKFQPEDIQQLRQLIKKASSVTTEAQQKAARRALFRFINKYIFP
ncbi:MAG: ribosome biogenesis factor YjgA [Gammaproteobacteria bacterium]